MRTHMKHYYMCPPPTRRTHSSRLHTLRIYIVVLIYMYIQQYYCIQQQAKYSYMRPICGGHIQQCIQYVDIYGSTTIYVLLYMEDIYSSTTIYVQILYTLLLYRRTYIVVLLYISTYYIHYNICPEYYTYYIYPESFMAHS